MNARRTLRQEAAEWQARLESPDCTADERCEFRLWRMRDVAHARAFSATQALAADVALLIATDPRLASLAERDYAAAGAVCRNGRRRVPKLATAVVALAASIAFALIGLHVAPRLSAPAQSSTSYTTATAEQRSVTLDDGSRIHLDVASRIEVRMTAKARTVELLAGRALFKVAHDVHRPFTVIAGPGQVVALGTCFQVQRDEERVTVTLAEGSVAVSGTGGARQRQERLRPGEQLSLSASDWIKRTVDPRVVTSWSHGRLIFRGTPLAAALDEINRYGARKIRLGDASLGSLEVGGNFIAGADSAATVAALEAVLPLHDVEGSGGEIVLFSGSPATLQQDPDDGRGSRQTAPR